MIPKARKELTRGWRAVVAASVVAFLTLNAATHTLRIYHWFTLLLIPVAMFSGERGRRFFLDWSPLFAFWISYDRLRLIQPLLLGRVAVGWPYELERRLFGWMANGDVPPHAARLWLLAHSQEAWGGFLIDAFQAVYLTQLFAIPGLMLIWWLLGRPLLSRRGGHWRPSNAPGRQAGPDRPPETEGWYRSWFVRCLYAFTCLNVVGFAGYLLLPVAPPWWITLHGMAQPSTDLVASSRLSLAMDGRIVRGMIATAPYWFGAIPSLHSAYPVLLALLSIGHLRRTGVLLSTVYALMMGVSCVVLNQHYIIDLVAGALGAVIAWKAGDYLFGRRTRLNPAQFA